MLLLRVLTRLIGVLWMVVLALVGLAVALYCLDAALALGSVRPDRLLHLPSARRHVGHFLHQLAAPGATAGLALLCGLGAIILGVLLAAGVLGPGKERQAVLEDNASEGRLTARRRVLVRMARALLDRTPGVTELRRPRLRLSRRGTRGIVRINVARARTVTAPEVEQHVKDRLAPLTEPFSLRPRVSVHLGERGQRVQ